MAKGIGSITGLSMTMFNSARAGSAATRPTIPIIRAAAKDLNAFIMSSLITGVPRVCFGLAECAIRLRFGRGKNMRFTCMLSQPHARGIKRQVHHVPFAVFLGVQLIAGLAATAAHPAHHGALGRF